MKMTIALVLIFLGAAIFIAPTAGSFLLQAMGRSPDFISYSEKDDCHVIGGVTLLVGGIFGILTALFSRPRAGARQDDRQGGGPAGGKDVGHEPKKEVM